MQENNLVTATPSTLAYAYDHLDIPPLTRQQETLVLSRARGLTLPQAARAAGYDLVSAKATEATDHFRILLNYLHEHAAGTIGITRERLNNMLFDAHDIAATAGERISAIRELGQLNDLYPAKGAQVNVQINQNNYTNEKQLRNLSEAELIKLADSESLVPSSDDTSQE